MGSDELHISLIAWSSRHKTHIFIHKHLYARTHTNTHTYIHIKKQNNAFHHMQTSLVEAQKARY